LRTVKALAGVRVTTQNCILIAVAAGHRSRFGGADVARNRSFEFFGNGLRPLGSKFDHLDHRYHPGQYQSDGQQNLIYFVDEGRESID
jgi:hypothetical protein